jgi:hypothetical protein
MVMSRLFVNQEMLAFAPSLHAAPSEQHHPQAVTPDGRAVSPRHLCG